MTHKNQNRWGDVKFMHFRVLGETYGLKGFTEVVEYEVAGKGGATVAYIEGEVGFTYATARCSDRDNYNGHIGRTIAHNRLFADRGDVFVGTREEFVTAVTSEMAGAGYDRQYKS